MTRDCDGVSPRFESHTGRIAKTLKNENFAVFFKFTFFGWFPPITYVRGFN